MPVEVIMPKVDMDMAAGKLAAWHVEEGGVVAKGAPLFDIETDKAAMEVEAPASGRLRHVVARPGQTVGVGAPMAWIYADGEAVGEDPGASPAPRPATPMVEPAEAAVGPSAAPSPTSPPEGLRATPAARRAAREAGLVLAEVAGTGPRGRIQGGDVVEALRARAAPAPRTPAPPAPAPAARPAPVEALPRTWAAAAGELYVSRRKGEGTPLLLLHGFTADSTGWAPFERELPKGLPLLRIDLPSHGRSPQARVTGFPDLLRAVTRAFDAACEGPVHLLGHSLGGALALGLADIRPRQVASLTLLAPAGLGPEIDAAALGGIARASRVESLAPWLKRLTATPDGLSWDFARAAMLARGDETLRLAQAEMADALFPDGVQAFDLHAALSRVGAPAAMVWGRDDAILPWRHALAAPGEMALHLLGEVGHIPHVECPARLAGIVARHIGAPTTR